MIKNYLKISVRSILKQKFYTFINVFGLSIGIAISLLILLFILAGTGALIIGWLTVSYPYIKAASANPVNLLRYE